MFPSVPMPKGQGGRVTPTATVISATPDPFGTLATNCGMYEGKVTVSLDYVEDTARRQALEDMMSTALQGPLETVQFTILIEGVTRSFTHQMVRERQAFFAQESMRFAVVEGETWHERAAMPPSVRGNPARELHWAAAMDQSQTEYNWLVNDGVPAEDARGVMPHDMTTRLYWTLDLRGLLHVAGLRLCTQAQFEWRLAMASVAKAFRQYSLVSPLQRLAGHDSAVSGDGWQWRAIADLLRPVCYQQGRCGFMAKFDRSCKIRDRVEANAKLGRPSSEWDKEADLGYSNDNLDNGAPMFPWGMIDERGRSHDIIPAISPVEWAADPTAAR